MAEINQGGHVPNDNFNDIQNLIGAQQTQKALMQSYLKHQDYYRDFMDGLVTHTKRSNEKILSNTEQDLGKFLGSINTAAKNSAKVVVDNLGGSFDVVAEKAEKAGKKVKTATDVGASGLGKVAQEGKAVASSGLAAALEEAGIGGLNLSMGIGAIGPVLQTVTGLLGRFLPQLAAMGSLAGIVLEFGHSFMKMQDAWMSFQQISGGSIDQFKQLQAVVFDVSNASLMTDTAVMGLAKSYYELGGNVSNANVDLKDYLITAGQAMKFYGISQEKMAGLMVTMQHRGLTGAGFEQTLGGFYEKMVQGHLGIEDFNSALDDGNSLWKEYGMQSGRTMDQFVNDMLNAKSAMRSFNVDVKEAQTMMEHLFSSPKEQMKTAAMVSQALGIPFSEAYNEKFLNPGQAMQQELMAAMSKYNQLTGGLGLQNPSNFANDPARMTGIMNMRQTMQGKVAQMFPGLGSGLGQFFNDFSAWQMANPGGSFQDWQQSRILQGQGGTSYEAAKGKLFGTVGNIQQNIQNRIVNFFDTWTTKAIPTFEALYAWLTGKPMQDAATGANDMIKDAWKATKQALKGQPAEAAALFPAAAMSGGFMHQLSAAQAMLESGNGKYMPPGSNNPFGIKALPGQPYVEAMTTEHGAHGNYRTLAKFAKFPDIHSAYEAHEKLLMNPHGPYRSTLPLLAAGDTEGYIKKMAGIYATDPEYAHKLTSILMELQKLNGHAAQSNKNQEDHTKTIKQLSITNRSTTTHDLLNRSGGSV